MGDRLNIHKLRTGKRREEIFRHRTAEQAIKHRTKIISVDERDPPLSLAVSLEQGDIWVTQQERENHFFVLGSTGERKSKFLEYLIRKDIDRLRLDQHLPKEQRRSCSLCFIDPTP